MTSGRTPPQPHGDWKAWALQMVEFLQDRSPRKAEVLAQPVFLQHQVTDERASSSGILMYDATQQIPTYSKDGAWRILGDMRWAGDFSQGTFYPEGSVVLDNGYLAIANKDTYDRPSPYPVGSPAYVYTGTLTEQSVTANQVIFGARYTAQQGAYIKGYRIFTKTDQPYVIYVVQDPLGTPVIRQIISFTASSDGWQEVSIPDAIITAGTSFDIFASANGSGAVQETPFTASYDYRTPQNPSIPTAGEIEHARSAPTSFRVNVIDDDATDQRANLLTMKVGDTIEGSGLMWTVQDITDNTTWFDFSVTPAITGSSGVDDFTFTVKTPSPVKYDTEANVWASEPAVSGLIGIDVGYNGVTFNDNAYGIDILVQDGEVSQDWDIMASSDGGNGGGGGSGATTFLELTDTPAAYAGHAGKAVTVKGTENGVEFTGPYLTEADGDARYLKAIDSGAVDFDTLVPTSTYVQNYRITAVPSANGYPGAGVGDWLTTYAYSGTAARQVGHNWNNGSNAPIYYRDKTSGTWGEWIAIGSSSGGADFDSDWITTVPVGDLLTPHGLGAIPSRYETYYRLKTAQGGWAAGTVVSSSQFRLSSAGSTATTGADATNLILNTNVNGVGSIADRGSTTTVVSIQETDVDVRFLAWT